MYHPAPATKQREKVMNEHEINELKQKVRSNLLHVAIDCDGITHPHLLHLKQLCEAVDYLQQQLALAKSGLCATCKGNPDTCGILSVTSVVTECAGYEEKEGDK